MSVLKTRHMFLPPSLVEPWKLGVVSFERPPWQMRDSPLATALRSRLSVRLLPAGQSTAFVFLCKTNLCSFQERTLFIVDLELRKPLLDRFNLFTTIRVGKGVRPLRVNWTNQGFNQTYFGLFLSAFVLRLYCQISCLVEVVLCLAKTRSTCEMNDIRGRRVTSYMDDIQP